MEKRYEGVDSEGQIHHPFTKGQLSFLLGIPKNLTKERAHAVVSKSVNGFKSHVEALNFRLRYDIFGDMNVGGGDGIDVIGWVLDNSWEGEGKDAHLNPQKVVDLIFQLRDEAASGDQ